MKKGLMELNVLFLVALIGWVDADFPWKNLRLRRDEFHFTRYHAGGGLYLETSTNLLWLIP